MSSQFSHSVSHKLRQVCQRGTYHYLTSYRKRLRLYMTPGTARVCAKQAASFHKWSAMGRKLPRNSPATIWFANVCRKSVTKGVVSTSATGVQAPAASPKHRGAHTAKQHHATGRCRVLKKTSQIPYQPLIASSLRHKFNSKSAVTPSTLAGLFAQ